MSLYVRVLNNFYTHRKTLRLKSLIGESAFWVPPRLWAYAASNQPDGCLEQYSPEEIAELIGYSSNASSMLQAMLKAGFLDANPLRIHGWEEHNNYHSVFAERAKKASAARWSKEEKSPTPPKEEKTVQDKDKETSIPTSIPTSMLQASDLISFLNQRTGSAFRPTEKNLCFISERLKERGVEVEGVKTMIDRQCALWLGTAQAEYLRPSTLFNATKFDGYYAAKDQPVIKGDSKFKRPEQNQIQEHIELKTL